MKYLKQSETPPLEWEIFQLLSQTARELGVPAYLVGGFVRDKLLARPCKDIDVVTIGSGIAFAKHFAQLINEPLDERSRIKVVIYERFGTAALHYKGLEIEFVGARKESYSPDSRKPAVEEGTLEDDQNRRDFTINALAISISPETFGDLVDSFGGVEDLAAKIIRTPLAPEITFSDDPLRMMRAVRFACQLGFEIHPETFEAIRSQAARIRIISQERISTELQKIMQSKEPSVGFKLLKESGLLAIIFPELQAMCGVDRIEGKGHKDNFYHSLQVLDNICPKTDNVWLRWAALLHDIGKPATKRYEQGHGWTFHGHEAYGANKVVPRIFQRLKLPLDHKLKYVQKLVEMHARPVALTKEQITDSALRRLLVEAGEELEDLLMLCGVDSTSQYAEKRQRYVENLEALREKIANLEERDTLRNWQPPITGDEIMAMFNLQPSKSVGILKTAVREAILDGICANNAEAAQIFVTEQAKILGLC